MADIIIPSSGNVWNSGFVQLPVSQITPTDMYTAWCAQYGLPSTGSVSNLAGDDGNTVCNGEFTLPGLSTSAFSVSYEGGLALYESANPNIHNTYYNYTGVDGLSDVVRLYFSASPNPPDIALVWGKSTDVMSTNTKWQKNSDVLVIFGNWYQRNASATWNVDVAIKITPTSYEIAILHKSGNVEPFQIFTLSGGQPAAGYGSQRFDYGIDGTYVFTNVANYINGLVKNGADNTPVGNVDIVSFNNVTDKVLQKVQSAVDGTYKLLVGSVEPTYVVVKSESIGYKVLDPTLYNDGDEVNITLGQTSGGDGGTPTFKAMCRGEVKEYGLPVKRKVVAVTVESTPRVVGSTESDEMTGAYEIDVAPWEGRVMVYYVPNIGNAFIPNAAFPLGYTVAPTEFNGYYYEVITAGVSGDAEPVWVNGGNTVSGTVVLTPKQVLTPLMNGWLLPSRENV